MFNIGKRIDYFEREHPVVSFALGMAVFVAMTLVIWVFVVK